MANTKSHHDINICLLFVQHLRLQNRVTHVYANFFAPLRNTNLRLRNFPDLTSHTVHFKSILSQKSCKQMTFFQESHTACNSDLLGAQFFCPTDRLLHPGCLTVIIMFDLSTCTHDLQILFISHVSIQCLLPVFRIHVIRYAKSRIWFVVLYILLCIAFLDIAVYT